MPLANIHHYSGPRYVQPASPLPTVTLIGTEKLRSDVSRGFIKEMEALLARIGVTGTCTCEVQTRAKGTAHTKGLRIKNPNPHGGVTITWHEGSNAECFQMSLRVPGEQDLFSLRTRLLNAKQQIEEEVAREKARHKSIRLQERTVGKKKDEHDAAEQGALGSSEKPENTATEPSPADPPNKEVSGSRFVDDLEKLGLFMLEIAPHVVKTGPIAGTVERKICSDILRDSFDIERTGPVMRSLEHNEHWKEWPSKEDFLLSLDWLRYIGIEITAEIAAEWTPPAPAPTEEPSSATEPETSGEPIEEIRLSGEEGSSEEEPPEPDADGPMEEIILPADAPTVAPETQGHTARAAPESSEEELEIVELDEAAKPASAPKKVHPQLRNKLAKDQRLRQLKSEIKRYEQLIQEDQKHLEELYAKYQRRLKQRHP